MTNPIPSEPELPPRLADKDGDDIPDELDGCPADAEDFDSFEDHDGCPEWDNDKDGIADAYDKCVHEPEVINGVDDEDGCPDRGLIVLVKDRIILEEQVLFDLQRARVNSEGKKILKAIVTLWRQHPEWESIVVEGHADQRGSQRYNLWLSKLRADRARRGLIRAGMPRRKFVL